MFSLPSELELRRGGMLKHEMRVLMRAVRLGSDPALGVRLAGHVLAGFAPIAGAVVAGFWPLPGEADVRPLMLALLGRGHVVALPVTPGRGAALVFRRWRAGMELISGRFGTLQTAGDLVVPDVLLVPMLAFDRVGRRLGYGAGYYDRTLEGLPGARTIGCAFAMQEVAAVPVEAHDRRMDLIATEVGVVVPE